MANKKISALTAATSLETGDVFPVVDVSVPETKKITRENLIADLQPLIGGIPIANAAGTVDAITADYSPNITLSDRRLCAFIASGANTSTTPTFAPDGLTAHTIVKHGGAALDVGDIPAIEAVCILQYDLTHTRWELLNPRNVSDTVYGAGWNGVTGVAPSKNAVYDQLQLALKGIGATLGTIIGSTQIQITYGGEAAHIKVQGISKYNGVNFSLSSAFTKSEEDATSSVSLSSGGNILTLEGASFFTGGYGPMVTVAGVIADSVVYNNTGTPIDMLAQVTGTDVDLNFYTASSGAVQDLTAIVTTGKSIYVHLTIVCTLT